MSRCTISDHFRGWECAICGQPMNPAHVTTLDRLDVAVCGACCRSNHKTTDIRPQTATKGGHTHGQIAQDAPGSHEGRRQGSDARQGREAAHEEGLLIVDESELLSGAAMRGPGGE